MIKVGITGNIACGKTFVEKFLQQEDFSVIDADFIVHNLLEHNDEIKAKVIRFFQNYNIFDETKSINRQKLGKLVFQDKKLKQKLEEIIHPAVKKEIERFFEKNKEKNIVFASIPLLFEAKMEKMFDKIILIMSDEKKQIERLTERNNYDKEHALLRINSQMNQQEKQKLSDFIINNNGTVEELNMQIKNVLSELSNKKS